MTNDNNDKVRQEIVPGFRYVHYQLGVGTAKILEASSFLYALIELLIERGIITEKELNERKTTVAKRLMEKFRELNMGAVFQEKEEDKYTFKSEVEIDCNRRTHLCKAACCKMSFALSRQDIEEGKIKWDLGKPYIIAKNGEGYCHHLDFSTYQCTLREQRPIPCRAYDCRNDKRIWLDFEKMIVNPELQKVLEKGKDFEALRVQR